jgi:hypothetical protein
MGVLRVPRASLQISSNEALRTRTLYLNSESGFKKTQNLIFDLGGDRSGDTALYQGIGATKTYNLQYWIWTIGE